MIEIDYRLGDSELEAMKGIFVSSLMCGDIGIARRANDLIYAEFYERYGDEILGERWADILEGGHELDSIAMQAFRNWRALRHDLIACERASVALAWDYFSKEGKNENGS